jgi:RNA polymerase sigma-70 factor (ECF subfamily)
MLHSTFVADVFEAFVATVPAPADARPRIEAKITDALARGAERWPDLVVSPQAFARAVAKSVADAPDPLAALDELHVTDLYLAQACADAAPGALAAFETLCRPAIDGSLKGMGLAEHVIADVTQEVRSKLFVGDAKINSYSGRASLKSWVRTVAIRTAVSMLRKGDGNPLDDKILEALPSPAAGPDLEHFRATYQVEFKDAFAAALASLTPQQRNLLRHRYVDGLAIEAIATLYGVHKTTAFRWLESAQTVLAKRTQNGFQQRTRATPSEMRRIVGLLQSNVELSLRRLLAD